MVLRWVAATFLITTKNFHRILGYRFFCMLNTKLENEVVFDSKPEVA